MDPKEIGQQILKGLRERLGDLWEERFTVAQRELAVAVANDAAALALRAMAGAKDEELAAERAHVEAALRNIAAIEASRIHAAFWAAAGDVLRQAAAALLISL